MPNMHFLVGKNPVINTIVGMFFCQDQENTLTVTVECHGRSWNRSITKCNMLERLHFQSSKDYEHGVLCMECISFNTLVY